jgi:hypothetical protein
MCGGSQSLFSFLVRSDTVGRNARELVLLSRARQALAEARTIDEVKDIRDKAQLAKGYAKKKGLALAIIVEASIVKVEAERKLGQLLRNLPLANSSPGNQHSRPDRSHRATGPIRLKNLGITKSESSRVQQIAALPKAKCDRHIADCVDSRSDPTTATCLRRRLSTGDVTSQ